MSGKQRPSVKQSRRYQAANEQADHVRQGDGVLAEAENANREPSAVRSPDDAKSSDMSGMPVEHAVAGPRHEPTSYVPADKRRAIGMTPARSYRRKTSPLAMIGRTLAGLLVLAMLAVVVTLGVLTITEYRPADTESVSVAHPAGAVLKPGQQLNLVTWNVGYCGLSSEADFFMDGGKGVRATSSDQVNGNLENIKKVLAEQNPDVMFLQEVDVDSARTYRIDEGQEFSEAFAHMGYSSAFAVNHLVSYIPYPWPPLGQMYAGIQTETRLAANSATRIQLPTPFKWPVRLANLKRCLLVERIPVVDSDKELVLVNAHLEAYDDGEGKAAQTRQLVQLLQREYDKGNYVIAAGDFNQTFSNVDTSAYPLSQDEGIWHPGTIDEGSFQEGWQPLMDADVPTCRSLDRPLNADDPDFQYYVIDGYICSENVQVDETKTVDTGFAFSDHNPVKLTATLIED